MKKALVGVVMLLMIWSVAGSSWAQEGSPGGSLIPGWGIDSLDFLLNREALPLFPEVTWGGYVIPSGSLIPGWGFDSLDGVFSR